MKKTILFVALLTIAKLSFAQYEITVKESNESFSTGSQNALIVNIYESNVKDVEKGLKKLFKDYKAKVSVKKEIFADDATIKDMSSNTVDIYATVKEGKENIIEVAVGFDLGGAYLSSSMHPNQFKVAKSMLYNFGVDMTKEAIKGQQKEAEKVLKTMEKDQEDLVKTNEDLHKAIEDYKEKIAKAEEDIEQNVKDQEEKTKEIEGQKATIEEIIAKEKAVK